jgi:HTH-type transcriptional regulator, transcriptional repressor of NAD biosynthesis genes
MAKMRGLTLGKFAPLHKGHQLVIETALREMDEVVVIVYDCPEITSIPLRVRANWIRTLYPTVQLIEARDGPTEVGDTAEIKQKHENYILNHLGITDISHFYSSEFYGDHMSRALGAVNRLVDPDRSIVPVSATEVRRDPFRFREYLDARVYRDLITNVVFLGAPSTGKTAIAARLASEYDTLWMPEYGREYWEQHQVNRRLTLEQLEEIALTHLEREEHLLFNARRFLFTDTNALTTYIFSLYYHGAATPLLERLAANAAARYDVLMLCGADIPYEDSSDRSGDVNRQMIQAEIVADLKRRNIPFLDLTGDMETRVRQAKAVLDPYQKYENK